MLTPLTIVWTFMSPPVFAAQTLSAEAVYRRCYIKFVRNIPNESDPLLLAARNESLTGAEACSQLLRRADWDTNGTLVRRQEEEARAIVRTFNELHRSWFSVDSLPSVTASYLIHDAEEPALFFTRAAFQPNTPFRSVLTSPSGLMGVRDQATYPNEISNFMAQTFFRYLSGYPYSESNQFHLTVNVLTRDPVRGAVSPAQIQRMDLSSDQLVEVGHLVGVKPSLPLVLPAVQYAALADGEIRKAVGSNMENHNLRMHFGGGVLGSQAFVMKNVNLGGFVVPRDYELINRRLTAKIFEDLLCHQLPTLSDDDVLAEVIPESVHPFQRTSSCMRCHSSIDKAAFGYRNLVTYLTSPGPNKLRQTIGTPSSGVGRLPTMAGAQHFALQPPQGVLHYRDLLTGTLRRAQFGNLNQLGTLLTNHNDFYLCATKRYYRFLTGVNVDVTKLAVSAQDLVHQQRVRQMAAQLKAHQNVRQLLNDMIASPAFQNTSATPEVP